ALGDAVNVAARMEQTADPATVRVTAETWDLVAEHFEGEEIGPVEVKGKSEPVRAIRVLGSSRPEDAPVPPPGRPLIGRAGESQKLAELRSRLMGGSGWVASIMGEAGLGKSRLLDAFREDTASSVATAFGFGWSGDLAWMSAFNESYDTSVPYSTVGQLLRRWWDLDSALVPYRRVEQVAEAVVPEVPDAAAYLGYVASVTLPETDSRFVESLEPPVLDARVRQTVMAYLESEARRRPVVVSLEDTHWADPMSLALLDDVMHLTETAPLGLVFTMRPYRDEPPWRVHEVAQRDHAHRYLHLDLASLGREAAESLLDSLLEDEEILPETRARILDRSDGNPLFVEQMVCAIREGGPDSGAVSVPTGLSSLLTSRLDRLDGESKTVAQIASVIGSEFDRDTLAALVGEEVDLDGRLTDLLRREILVERRNRASTLAFHHSLMQDAAYSTMLLRTRRELHTRLAEHLEAEDPHASQEIARHFLEAGDPDRAFPHLIEAGERLSRSMALSDAIHSFTTALEHLPSDADPELVVRAHDGLGVAYTLVPDLTRSEATYQRMSEYADRAGTPSAKVTALNRLAMTSATLAGDLSAAHGYLEDARAVATEAGDEMGLAQYHMNACTIAGLGGDIATSVVHDEEVARQGRELGVAGIRVEGLARLAANRVWLMDFAEAEAATDEALEAAGEIGDEHTEALLKAQVVSRLRLREGDTGEALRLSLEGGEVLDRYASFFSPLTQITAAWLLWERGRLDEAKSCLDRAGQVAADAHFLFFVAAASAGLARIHGSLGWEEARRQARAAALEAVGSPLGGYVGSTVWADLGDAELAAGDLAAAASDFSQGLSSSSASKYWEKPRLLIGLARARAGQGEVVEAHRLLDEAGAYLLDKEVRTFDAHLEHARGEVELAGEEPEEAVARLTRAGDLARL
ncbi:MAG: AAA family ATPase, partial [Actinomycetota bacterium]